MVERDRQLLAYAAEVNRSFGAAVVQLLSEQDGGQLPAARLHAIGTQLGELSAAFLARAAELDGRVPDTPERVVIDGRSD